MACMVCRIRRILPVTAFKAAGRNARNQSRQYELLGNWLFPADLMATLISAGGLGED